MELLLEKSTAIAAKLKETKTRISIAESSAGGLIAANLLAVPGASAYFIGGGVFYTVRSRDRLIGLSKEELDKQGLRPSTEAYARLMSETLQTKLGTDWGLGESGATGPTGNAYGDAPGHCCLAITGPVTLARTIETGLEDRAENMGRFTRAALDLLAEALEV